MGCGVRFDEIASRERPWKAFVSTAGEGIPDKEASNSAQ